MTQDKSYQDKDTDFIVWKKNGKTFGLEAKVDSHNTGNFYLETSVDYFSIYQEQLADEYKYKPIPRTFFKDVRAEFEETLPEWCNMSGDTTKLETRSGTVIASGYNRIVIGDYGAFVEFSRAQANARHLKIKEGQSYRIEDPRYAEHVKYLWLTADDSSDVKVYDQKRSVEYADYKPGMLYVSVYEVFPAETDAGLS